MIVDRLIQGAAELRATLNDPNQAWLDMVHGGEPTAAGVPVNEDRSLQMAAVSACVERVSTSIAGLPLIVYEKTGATSRRRADDDALASRLRVSPNPEQTAFEFFEQVIGYAMLWSHAEIYIERKPGPGAPGLWPLRPDRIEPRRGETGLLGYDVKLENGEKRFVRYDEVISIRRAGYTKKGRVQRMRQTIGLALAAEEFGARFYGQGASMAGFVEVPQGANLKEVEKLEAELGAKHQGLTRSHLIGMLTGGATWKEVGMPLREAQYIEGRKFTGEEVCRWMGVQAHKVGFLDRATFSNIEEQNIEYVVDTLASWTIPTEQAFRMRLFPPRRGVGYGQVGDRWPEFLMDALLRGNTLARYQAYALAIQWGWMTRADVRERENLNELDDRFALDEPLQPLNMMPAGSEPEEVDPATRALVALLTRGHQNGSVGDEDYLPGQVSS